MYAEIKAAFEANGDNKFQGLLDALAIILKAIFGFVEGEVKLFILCKSMHKTCLLIRQVFVNL